MHNTFIVYKKILTVEQKHIVCLYHAEEAGHLQLQPYLDAIDTEV